MLLVKDVVVRIRELLNYPPHGKIPNHRILLRLSRELTDQQTRLSLPNENRILDQKKFSIGAGQKEKPLGITWGGPVLVQTYSTDANFEVREVDIVPISNQDKFYLGPQTGGGSATEPHIAASFTFYTRASDNQLVVRPNPVHSAPAEYLVFFQPAAFIQPGTENNYMLPEEFVALVEVRVAKSLLPSLIERNDKGAVTNEMELELLQGALSEQEARYGDTFELKKSLSIPQQSGPRIGWSNYYDDGLPDY
jgi:hypothetical protein